MLNINFLDISIYQIQLFLAVAKEKNFSKAAERMHITQPSLSKRINSLEQVLGFELFDRTSRPLKLSPSGEYLYGQWNKLAHLIESSIEKAYEINSKACQALSVGGVDSFDARFSFSAICKVFLNNNPDVSLQLNFWQFDELKNKLVDDEVDVAFTVFFEASSLAPQFEYEEVIATPEIICMLTSNPLSSKDSLTFADIADQNFVIISPIETQNYFNHVTKVCNANGFSPRVARYVNNAHQLVLGLRSDNDVVLCDRFLSGIDNPNIKCFPMPNTRSAMIAVWRKNNSNPNIRFFVEAVHKYYSE